MSFDRLFGSSAFQHQELLKMTAKVHKKCKDSRGSKCGVVLLKLPTPIQTSGESNLAKHGFKVTRAKVVIPVWNEDPKITQHEYGMLEKCSPAEDLGSDVFCMSMGMKSLPQGW